MEINWIMKKLFNLKDLKNRMLQFLNETNFYNFRKIKFIQ